MRRDPQRDPRSTAAAFYEIAEIHRLRGDFREAEDAYRDASRYGCEPQPGLALLRLKQGRARIAAAAIRRVVGTAQAPLERVKLLPAYVEIMLGVGDLAAARAAADELERIAMRFDTELIAAAAAHARGEIELAEDDAYAALASLRRALGLWQELRAPYLAARARVSIGVACRALGDEDGAALELESARAAFERLEAQPDLAHVDALRAQPRGRAFRRRTASRSASSRCCGTSQRGRRTGRSRPSSRSARRPSTATSATSLRSSTFRRGRRRRLTRFGIGCSKRCSPARRG